uniref:Uncharacterized protein n=1 Tax=Desulfobacca acetoxidans TaxID=60893 RepID=A0A7V4G9A2_9BACT
MSPRIASIFLFLASMVNLISLIFLSNSALAAKASSSLPLAFSQRRCNLNKSCFNLVKFKATDFLLHLYN